MERDAQRKRRPGAAALLDVINFVIAIAIFKIVWLVMTDPVPERSLREVPVGVEGLNPTQ